MRRMDKHENKRERMKSGTIILALLFIIRYNKSIEK